EQLQFSGHTFNLAGADLNHASSFNGDRFDDVLFQSDQSGQLIFSGMYAGSPTGFQTATGNLPGGWIVGGHGDVNNDGFADVVVQNPFNGQISVALEHGTGTPTWLNVGSTPGWAVRAVADVNGDSFSDIVIQNDSSGAILYANMADGHFSGWVSVANVPGW